MESAVSKEETYTGYDNSGYVGTQQDWQEHWNWGGESDFTSDQYYGNVAFFVPFQGMAGVAGDSSMTANAASTGQGTSKTEGESSQSLQEVAQKMAKLQAENQRLMHLCEVERRMRHIEVTAFQQTLEMYAVPHSEVDQLVRRFQEDGPTALNYGDMNDSNQYGLYSNATGSATGATGSGTGTTGAVSLESLLQDLYKKLYEPTDEKENNNRDLKDMKDTEEWGAKDTWEASYAEIEEVEQYLCHLESMVEMTIDERARTTLLSMTPEQGKMALSKVEEIIREQGGYCRSLSSMVQSVCRKTGHAAKQ